MRYLYFLNLSFKLIILFLVPFLLTSCGRQRIQFKVETFADKKSIPNGFMRNKAFFVLSEEQSNQCLSKEISQKISAILEAQGFIVVKYVENADYYLLFNRPLLKL